MLPAASAPAVAPSTAESSRTRVTSRILRLTNGEPAYTAQIQSMMWNEYCEAGSPLGRSENGMFVWWDRKLSD